MIKEVKSKEVKIAVIGLGYVGLPIALEFARKASVIGYDIHAGRVKMLQNAEDPSQEDSWKEGEDQSQPREYIENSFHK